MRADRQIPEIACDGSGQLPDEVLRLQQPHALKGLVAHWPLVAAATQSADAADRYLREFDNQSQVTVSTGPAEINGRIFYNADMSGFNFEMHRSPLAGFLDELKRWRDADAAPVHYVGSTTVEHILPGLRDANDLDLGPVEPLVSIWLGNQSRIAAHYDIPDNIACVAAGRRRFTLFPPDQLKNLYVGPLDFAPAGQAISLVDICAPDFKRFPKYRQALEHAQDAELGPGDAIFIPSMWWHHVEGLSDFNVLINYWWRRAPAYMGSPMNVLHHALLSIRDLPATQRAAWRDIFEHYIFAPPDDGVAHIPENRRGMLAPIDDLTARKLRALLLKQLNR